MELSEIQQHHLPGNGCTFYERVGGEPCWLFLHGNGCDSADWLDVWRCLPEMWRLVALDLRGHGASPLPVGSITFEDLVTDVLQLLSWLGGQWYLVGHSLGGMVALRVAEQSADHLKGLVLLEGWTNLAYARSLSENFYGTLDVPQRLAIQQRTVGTFSRWPKDLWNDYWDSIEAADATDLLATTNLPVVEIYGDHGLPQIASAAVGVPDRPNIELRWVPGAGHYLPVERSQSVARACRDLVRGFA